MRRLANIISRTIENQQLIQTNRRTLSIASSLQQKTALPNELANQPLPKLTDTLTKYRRLVASLTNNIELRNESKLVIDNEICENAKLSQQWLKNQYNNTDNWLTNLWLKVAHLESRNTPAINSTMSGCYVDVLGYGLLAYLIGRVISIFYNIVYPYFIYRGIPNLPQYTKAKWAVVTGSTDGIGKSYAFELARKNMNLVLIARNPNKLAAVKKEINDKYSNIEIKTVKFDFSTNNAEQYKEMYDSNKLDQLDVGMLVNNVGVSYDYPKYLDELTYKEITDHIHCNSMALVMMMHLFVGQMKARKAGLIVNFSSGTGLFPLPLFAVYGATKSFVKYLTPAIQAELQKDGIKCQTVIPFYVTTNMTGTYMASDVTFFKPAAPAYAKATVRTLGAQSVTHGYWTHQILGELTKCVPIWFMTKFGMNLMTDMRKEKLRELSKKK